MLTMTMKFTRKLNVRIRGRDVHGEITISPPKLKPGTKAYAPAWVCLCTVTPIDKSPSEICGEDPLDAVLNCIRFIARLIEKHKPLGYRVWWLHNGDDGGFHLTAKSRRPTRIKGTPNRRPPLGPLCNSVR
jgi:hypothetical protein